MNARLNLRRGSLAGVLLVAVACGDSTEPGPDTGVVTVEVTPASIALDPGREVTVSAVPRNARGEIVSGKPVSWESNAADIATVSANGVVRAHAPGEATITAVVDSRRGNATVAVPGTTVADIVLSHTSLALRSFEDAELVATPVDANGTALPDRLVTWESSSPAVRVTPIGAVWAVALGQAMLTARSGGKSATVSVAVAPFTDYDLVFERVEGGRRVLFVQDLNGGGPERLLPAGISAQDAAASPDGTKIVFAALDEAATPAGSQGDLYVSNRDGSNIQRLTNWPGLEHQPAWSPDGTRLVFRRDIDGTGGDIWVMDRDGSSASNLTPDPLPDRGDERYPAWSSVGWIAYTSTLSGGTEIWVMDSKGAQKYRRSNTSADETRPVWFPEGLMMAFAQRYPGKTTDLAVVSDIGGDVLRVELPGDQEAPAWSPDGRMLAFSSTHEGANAIYLLHFNNLEMVRLTSGPGAFNPSWARRP